MTLRICTIVGARPQFIKAAAFSRALQKYSQIEEFIIHTGQHFDSNMSDVFFQELSIPKPRHFLNINNGSHGYMTGRMMESIETILLGDRPDIILVYGDTDSTLAGALAAAKLHIPVVHVEAGLRSFNQKMPEEINRILTDHVSSYLFCPTQLAVHNLKKEAIEKGVYHVGDIMYDATLYALDYIKNDSHISEKFSYLPEKFVFMTIHRAQSTMNGTEFKKIIDYAACYAKQHNLRVIFPVHPRTRFLIEKSNLDDTFILLEPLSYFETHYCLQKSSFVLTDSGGLQKEAYFHRIPCVTLRSETEWVETITHGWNRLWFVSEYQSRQEIEEYGSGNCADKIVNILLNTYHY